MRRLRPGERTPDHAGRSSPDGSAPTATSRRASCLRIENHRDRPEVRAALAGRRRVAPPDAARPWAVRCSMSRCPAVRRWCGSRASLDQVDEIVPERAAGGRGRRPARARGGQRCSPPSRAGPSPDRSPTSAAAARAIAAGAPPRFPRSGIPDIDALVQALRQMHRQLGDRFDELRREQAETSALVESMVEGVIAADERGRIVTANPAARRLLGYERDRSAARPARAVPGEGGAGGGGRGASRARRCEDRELEMDGRAILMNARPLPAGRRGAGHPRSHRASPARGGAPRLRGQRVARAQDPAHLDLGLRRDAAGGHSRSRDHPAVPQHHPRQRPADAAAGGRSARPGPHRVGPLAAEPRRA